MMKMSVSSVIGSGKDKKIYILFSDKDKSCEGIYPDCKITKNEGFSDEEVSALEEFMEDSSDTIKDMAKTVNLWSAFSK